MTKSDPTKDPEFQKTLKNLLSMKPKPHSEMKVGKESEEIEIEEEARQVGRAYRLLEKHELDRAFTALLLQMSHPSATPNFTRHSRL